MEAARLELADNLLEIDVAAAEWPERPVAAAAGGVFQVHMDDSIDDRLEVGSRIDVIVVEDGIAGVIVDTHGVVVNSIEKPAGDSPVAGQALVDLECHGERHVPAHIAEEPPAIADSTPLFSAVWLIACRIDDDKGSTQLLGEVDTP